MKIIGIDLGTSNCCISYINDDGNIEIIRDCDNKITIPSLVEINNDLIFIGNEIDKKHISNNKNIFHNFKRLIGHSINDIHTTNLKEILNYKIDEINGKIVCIDDSNKSYHLVEIIYLLLRRIKTLIDNHMGIEEWQCIVTIPAYFNEIQRNITMSAINIAKLPIIKLINEPTAASFAYFFHNKILHEQTFNKKILVIDYGAGTLDLTIMEIIKENDDIENIFCEVLGSFGDNNFGGIDITKKIYNTMFNSSNMDLNLKMQICEDIKIMLSMQTDATYYCNELNKTFYYSYDTYIKQLNDFKNHILLTIDGVLNVANLNKIDIDDIVLVGGSFKNPYFRKEISDYFNKTIIQPRIKLSNIEYLLYEDIAVSFGASVYGYYMNMTKDIILIEKLPLSIGIETANNNIVKIITQNSVIPTSQTKIFMPEDQGQDYVDINIYQGESIFKEKCYHIGDFKLCNLLTHERPRLFVTISVDTNGIITVKACDKKGINSEQIKIETKSIMLTEDEINKIMENYILSAKDEQLYKEIISNYYLLISFINKISYQLNYNSELQLHDKAKQVIKTDIALIANKMDNKFIIKKYKLNTAILYRTIIINDLEFNNTYKQLTDEQIEKYNNLLIQLKEYLVDRYETYLSIDEDEIMASSQVSKLETLDDNDDNIDKNLSFINNDKIENLSDYITSIKKINIEEQIENPALEYNNLMNFLELNIESFELNAEGIQLLNNRIIEEKLNLYKDSTEFLKALNELNEFCIYIKNSF